MPMCIMCETLRSLRKLMCVAARRIPLRTVRELEEPGEMERATEEQLVDLVSYCLGCRELASEDIAAHVVTGALLLTVPSASRALHKSGLEKTAVNYFNMAMLMGVARHIRDQHQIPVSPLPCVCWWMAFQPKYACMSTSSIDATCGRSRCRTWMETTLSCTPTYQPELLRN